MTNVRLGDVLEPRREVVHPRDNPSGDALFVGLEHIESNTGRRIGGLEVRLEELTGRKPRFHAGDIVYGYLRPYLNKVWVADRAGLCSVDQYVFEVRYAADPQFVAAYLRSPMFLARAPVDETPGQLPRIRLDEVLAVTIDLPALPEQHRLAVRLAAKLAAAAKSDQACRERRSDLNALRELVYRRAFEMIVPLTVERSHETEPTDWSWVRLTDVARLESGHTPSRDRPDWWGGDIPWIALPDIRALDGAVAFETGETTNLEGIAHSSARVLPAGTVVMSRTASVGFVTRMGRPMATSQDFVNWVCGPNLDPEFLMHLLIRSRPYVRELASGAIHKTVYMPTVKAFKVCVPSIQEQRRIVSELRSQLAAIDAASAALNAQIAAIEHLPAALLNREFEVAKAF